jgi:hypothetical protein
MPQPVGMKVGLNAIRVPVGALWLSMSACEVPVAVTVHEIWKPPSPASPPPLLLLDPPLLLPPLLLAPLVLLPPLLLVPPLLLPLKLPGGGELPLMFEHDMAAQARAVMETIVIVTGIRFLDMKVLLSER